MTKDRPVRERSCSCTYIDHIYDIKVVILTTYFIHYIANFLSPQIDSIDGIIFDHSRFWERIK
jgi:hypothetical protein